MRRLFYIACIFFSLCLTHCAKEYSHEGGFISGNDSSGLNNEKPVKSEWQFEESSNKYEGPVDTAYLTQEDKFSVLTVTGKSATNNEVISFLIRGLDKIEKGKTYSTTHSEVKFLYKNEDTIYFALPYAGGDVSVTITDIADNKVTGTFKGLVKKEDGRSYSVSEGKFSSPLKRVAASEAKGYIMLYAREDCNGPINVKVNNQPGVIDKFNGIVPDCGEAGSATFNFSPGTYEWVAYCGKDSVHGEVELKAGSCAKIQVTFPIKPSPTTETEPLKMCRLSNVSYSGELFPLYENSIDAAYSGHDLNQLSYIVKVPSFAYRINYSVRKEGNRVIIEHPDGIYQNYFVLDDKGRVIEYVGNTKPDTINSVSPEFASYEYDNENHLIKRTFYKDNDRRPINEMRFTWENGNIVSIKIRSLITGDSFEYRYEYFDKPVRAMPFFYTEARELIMYQSAINFGEPVKNLPKKISLLLSPNTIKTFSFYGYVMDNNNYVQAMRIRYENGRTFSYSFRYKCF